MVKGDFDAKAVEWQKMFATKSRTFEHEDKCRIVVPPSAENCESYAWRGHGLYQHHPDAITQIVLGELLPAQDKAAIRVMLAGRNVDFLRAKRVDGAFSVILETA